MRGFGASSVVLRGSIRGSREIGSFAVAFIVAGGIANRTGDVVGVSNIFTPEDAAQDFWASFVHMAMETFPGLALVDYERGADLKIAHSVGFQSIGPLRVWVKPTQ